MSLQIEPVLKTCCVEQNWYLTETCQWRYQQGMCFATFEGFSEL